MSESTDLARSARLAPPTRGTPMSTIESSVTRLLVLTKHLLESLTQWAHKEVDDKYVLDAYVKLGNDFRAAGRSFASAGVQITDLGDVPRALRIVLESALSEEPTEQNLDKFLPRIRSIIVSLLLNLKTKQARAKELAEQNINASHDNIANVLPNPKPRNFSDLALQLPAPPNGSNRSFLESLSDDKNRGTERPRRTKILADMLARTNLERSNEDAQEQSKTHSPQPSQLREQPLASSDALAKLQKGNVILRRASKRFSAYQFAKLANYSGSQILRLSAEAKAPHVGDVSADDVQEVTPDVSAYEPKSENVSSGSYIFLRIGDQTKKAEVQFPVTMASLRLLFVEKFAYSPKSASFPEIYALDPRTNVSFELEEHRVESEVESGSLLLLKAPSHQDEALHDLKSSVQALSSRMDSLSSELVIHFKDALESAALSAQLTVLQTSQATTESSSNSSKELESRNSVLTRALRLLQQELKSAKQMLETRDAKVKELAEIMQNEIVTLKDACLEESSPVKSRSFMEQSYARLSEDSDSLLTKVDDLQDMMEALRKDVAQRGVRLGPKQLKSTHKEIFGAKLQLSELIEYIRDGKPTWKKIWESELDKVCEEQQFFNLQDDLTRDLDEDIRKIEETFELIEKCSIHQSKQNPKKNSLACHVMPITPGESVYNLRDAVLSEVSALKPNHESRLDAIAKAERIREREKQLQSLTQFQEELGDFVEEKKLKSSGGIEELEKRRQQQDAENLKSSLGVV